MYFGESRGDTAFSRPSKYGETESAGGEFA